MIKYSVVVGGGISGLFSAWLLKQIKPHNEVLLLESNSECGGLLRSFDYGENGRFDYGVHTLYETGVARIDEAIFGTLPDRDWKILAGREKDLGGSWIDGRIQFDTPYPVLSNRNDIDELIADFVRSIGTSSDAPCDDSKDELIRLFGQKIANRIMIPAIESRHNLPAEEINSLALQVHGMSRIAALPLEAVLKLGEISGFNSRIAFPNQYKSPVSLISKKRAFYPKAGYLSHFTDRFVTRIVSLGVKIATNATVRSFDTDDGQVRGIHYEDANGMVQRVEVDRILWCAGIPAAAKILDIASFLTGLIRPPTTVVCNMLVKGQPNTGGVYYGYFHGKPVANRFSFPSNVSGVERADGLSPIALELIYPAGVDTSNAVRLSEEAFRSSGIVDEDTQIAFAKAEVLKAGYPSFNRSNFAALKRARDAIFDLNISNLSLFGPLVRDDLFFQFDILRHIEETVGE